MIYALIGLSALCVLVIILDALGFINITLLALSCAEIAIVPHVFIVMYSLVVYSRETGVKGALPFLTVIACAMLLIYITMRLHINPVKGCKTHKKALRIMLCGRRLVLLGIFNFIAQIPLCIFGYRLFVQAGGPVWVWITDLVLTIVTVFVYTLNGIIRILATSKRYGAVKKLIICLLLLIPIVNVFVLLKYCREVKHEYDHEAYMVEALSQAAESELCSTKYPIVLVHGVGFRDYKYLNYWGRIPRELTRQGARIFYGHQQAWTTIAGSAENVKQTVLEVLEQTGAEKVNIIAHSKGGLDARYLISRLGMGDRVASLTTISTPHRGTKLVDFLIGIAPEKLHRSISKAFDSNYKRLGDTTPDFYTTSKEFLTSYAEKFNEEVPDDPQVYYQSYMTIMKNFTSDWLLTIPYLIMYFKQGKNDGLVCVESAKWGNFRGVITNKHRRGISHGDIIDLERENIYGFDIIKTYIDIVSDLKNMGYL